MEHVILVNEQDEQTGTMEKMEAHVKGELHRAFSIFLFNSKNEMLLQQRAITKYHSGGLWTNACCSHPRPGEQTDAAAQRRLYEELGFTASFEKIFDFHYHAAFDNGLTEHEFDHVYAGTFEGDINPNAEEVQDYKYVTIEEIESTLQTDPLSYTAWFHIAFPKVKEWMSRGR
jgi:isopentenyl-diphosphate delta-isomerase